MKIQTTVTVNSSELRQLWEKSKAKTDKGLKGYLKRKYNITSDLCVRAKEPHTYDYICIDFDDNDEDDDN